MPIEKYPGPGQYEYMSFIDNGFEKNAYYSTMISKTNLRPKSSKATLDNF